MNKLRDGFSLTELIISITVSTLLLTACIWFYLSLNHQLTRLEVLNQKNYQNSRLLSVMSELILNADLIPRRPSDQYQFSEDHLIFFSAGKKIEIRFEDRILTIDQGEFKRSFRNFNEFLIRYYDKEGYEINESEFPAYAEMRLNPSGNSGYLLKIFF